VYPLTMGDGGGAKLGPTTVQPATLTAAADVKSKAEMYLRTLMPPFDLRARSIAEKCRSADPARTETWLLAAGSRPCEHEYRLIWKLDSSLFFVNRATLCGH